MAKENAYGSQGRKNVHLFDPDDLVIVTDEKHPLFDKRGLEKPDQAMVRSVKHVGIFQPVLVRKNPETGAMEVIAGRKRVLAAREANHELLEEGSKVRIQVPADVRQGSDVYMTMLMVIENEHREADTPLNKAEKMRRFLDMGACEDDVATSYKCSVSTLKNYLSLLEVTAVVKKAVEEGTLPVSEAYKLSKLEPEAQREAVAKVHARTNGSTAKRKKGVREALGKTLRGKREILKMREKYQPGEADTSSELHDAVVHTLDWVLGERERIGVKL